MDITRLFVIDTNVLVHDPSALFRFKEHDIYLPMVVLEELDQGKKGLSDTARNIRQANRFLDELVKNKSNESILQGIELIPPNHVGNSFPTPAGKLFFQSEEMTASLPDSLPGNKPDNSILATTLTLQSKYPNCQVILVSKDINLRIKAAVLGIHAEDYQNDQVVDDLRFMYAGTLMLGEDFWITHSKEMSSWKESGRTFYKITGDDIPQWMPNLCLYSESDPHFEAIVRDIDGNTAQIEYAKDYRRIKNKVWSINARNREQNFALNHLMDPDIDFVTLVGAAGTGKTLLTLAAAMAQTLEQNLYREILVTRVTVPLGEDIGFLPGSEEEKMTPWMGALMDNLEVLTQSAKPQIWEGDMADLTKYRIKIRSLNFMRGRTFLNKFIIIDEAQNLTSKQMQTLVTRAGPGTKIVCLGNINQIDTPYLTETTSGLTYVVHCFKNWAHSAHITLARGERSRLADHAIEVL